MRSQVREDKGSRGEVNAISWPTVCMESTPWERNIRNGSNAPLEKVRIRKKTFAGEGMGGATLTL
jgi:hypothetical protein